MNDLNGKIGDIRSQQIGDEEEELTHDNINASTLNNVDPMGQGTNGYGATQGKETVDEDDAMETLSQSH